MEEIANPFTFPPSQYRNYTKRNLVLLGLLRTRSETKLHDEIPLDEQHRLLADQGEPAVEWDLTRLEPPRIDWIAEDGGYEAFGDFWPLPDRELSLEEHGVLQLYPKVPDHRPALRKLLRTTLVTFNELLGALLIPPSHDPGAQQPPEFVQHIEWLRLNATNMIAAVNELRPVQARATLEMAMTRQLSSRREATKALHAYVYTIFLKIRDSEEADVKPLHLASKCDELEAQLAALQTSSNSTSEPQYDSTSHPGLPEGMKSGDLNLSVPVPPKSSLPPGLAEDTDLLAWANECAPL